ncbi:MAG TPA: hypothetical protein VGL46_05035 [Pseudonocardiaceae bacterium]|jgi:hypothetical protein
MPKLDPATKAAIKAIVDAQLGRKGVTVRDILKAVLDAGPDDPIRQMAARQIKARVLVRLFASHPGKNGKGALTLRPRGSDTDVVISRIDYGEADDVSYVDIYADGATVGGDPHFRIINPPMLVEDPAGDIVVTSKRRDGRMVTRTFREDPLAAIAEAIAGQGGAQR